MAFWIRLVKAKNRPSDRRPVRSSLYSTTSASMAVIRMVAVMPSTPRTMPSRNSQGTISGICVAPIMSPLSGNRPSSRRISGMKPTNTAATSSTLPASFLPTRRVKKGAAATARPEAKKASICSTPAQNRFSSQTKVVM